MKMGGPLSLADSSLSAHFEHTVAILSDGPEILTYNPELWGKGLGVQMKLSQVIGVIATAFLFLAIYLRLQLRPNREDHA